MRSLQNEMRSLHDELQQRLVLINRLNTDLERIRADGEEKERLIASLHAAAERARADGEEKERLIASLHAAAMARLNIIERLDTDLRDCLARNQVLEKRYQRQGRARAALHRRRKGG
jgi:chromosome segregation ATPase